ncbi:hypothetical protein ES703_34995 [subsurface metagenome]
MEIDEAIKTSKEVLGGGRLNPWPEAQAAVQLGIEALKRLKEAREQHLIRNDSPLPGETEDSEKQFLSSR